jgi:2-succinyl-5-enolpyruvyl-6-hydroxy-3-cyclohexene-1-carboxylate synthase
VNPSTALATTVVDELVRHGVREAVLCPGSRSAVFAYALQEADRAGRLRLHVRVDERSAAFLALGMAKLTRRPVPVFTTSGTAVANLHPAVLEASHGAVPLIIVSADRPAELQGTGANQSTDQTNMFGSAVRMFHQLGAPQRRKGQNAQWRSVVSRLHGASVGASGSDAGPVHLNVPLREPLVPDLGSGVDWPENLQGRGDAGPWVLVRTGSTRALPLAPVPRTLIVLGDLPDPAMSAQVAELARTSGWPMVAEPFGAHDRRNLVPHGPLLLTAGDWLRRHLPERVLLVGRVTLSRPVGDLLRDPAVRVEVVSPRCAWPDPSHVASVVYPFDAVQASIAGGRAVDEAWAAQWADAGELMSQEAAAIIDGSWPSGLAIAATVLAELPPAATLFLGSSNCARDVDLAMSGQLRSAPLTILASRGLAGIDGCVSTAVGIALSAPPRATYALMGDLAFLHDSNGLLIGPHEPRPDLSIVVANDDGGGIFTLLEPGEPGRAADFERVFGTPTGACVADIAHAHAVRYSRATSQAELGQALRERPSGLSVLEVRLDRSQHRDLHAQLRAAAAAGLAT